MVNRLQGNYLLYLHAPACGPASRPRALTVRLAAPAAVQRTLSAANG